MIYSGPCRNAQPLLSSCPAVSLNTTRCDNPGDFIIDVLGLEDDEEDSDAAAESSEFDQSSTPFFSEPANCTPSEFESFVNPVQRPKSKSDISVELSNHFLQSSEYIMLLKKIEGGIRILQRPLDLDFRDLGVRSHAPIHRTPGTGAAPESADYETDDKFESEDGDEELGLKSIPMRELSSAEDRMVKEFLSEARQEKLKPYFSLPAIVSDIDAGRSSQWAGNVLEVKALQLWVLFARRVTVATPQGIASDHDRLRCSGRARSISAGVSPKWSSSPQSSLSPSATRSNPSSRSRTRYPSPSGPTLSSRLTGTNRSSCCCSQSPATR
jgi:hypothetical protein